MKRSKWKGPYVDTTLINDIKKYKLNNEIKTFSRSSEILPIFVNKIFNVHNGNNYTKILITNEMIGHKFGEFSFTRKKFTFKKNK